MAAPDWKTLRDLWDLDEGALRDIYVPNATAADWQAVLEVVTGRWPFSYLLDGEPGQLPDARTFFAEARQREAAHLLRVAVTPLINLNAHFFGEDEIEFDFDPRELLNDADLAAILDFMRVVGRTLRKPVLVSIESSPHLSPELRYNPQSDEVVALDWHH